MLIDKICFALISIARTREPDGQDEIDNAMIRPAYQMSQLLVSNEGQLHKAMRTITTQ